MGHASTPPPPASAAVHVGGDGLLQNFQIFHALFVNLTAICKPNEMDAPRCRLCEKRHYGTCADPRTPGSESKKARPKKKSKKVVAEREPVQGARKPVESLIEDAKTEAEFMALIICRIGELEDRVEKLETRKRYQKKYMRDRRARE